MKLNLTIENPTAEVLRLLAGVISAGDSDVMNNVADVPVADHAKPVIQAVEMPPAPIPAPAPVASVPAMPAAPIAPVNAEPAPAAGEMRDVNGIRWDERIHSAGQSRLNQDGTWRRKRGVDDAVFAAVEAELRGEAPAAVAAAPMPTQAAPVAPPAVPMPPAPVAPPPAVPMPPPAFSEAPAPVAAPVAAPQPFTPPAMPVQAAPAPMPAPVPPQPAPAAGGALTLGAIMAVLGPKLQSGAINVGTLAEVSTALSGKLGKTVNSIMEVDNDPVGLLMLQQVLVERGIWQ